MPAAKVAMLCTLFANTVKLACTNSRVPQGGGGGDLEGGGVVNCLASRLSPPWRRLAMQYEPLVRHWLASIAIGGRRKHTQKVSAHDVSPATYLAKPTYQTVPYLPMPAKLAASLNNLLLSHPMHHL